MNYTKKIFTTKSNDFENTVSVKNSIIFQHYIDQLNTNIIIEKSTNIPVFHNDNNIEILYDFINELKWSATDMYSKIYLIIDQVCFITLINDKYDIENKNELTENFNTNLYICYKNISHPMIVNSILNISINDNVKNLFFSFLSGAFVSAMIMRGFFMKRN